jgi:hypothetical protein
MLMRNCFSIIHVLVGAGALMAAANEGGGGAPSGDLLNGDDPAVGPDPAAFAALQARHDQLEAQLKAALDQLAQAPSAEAVAALQETVQGLQKQLTQPVSADGLAELRAQVANLSAQLENAPTPEQVAALQARLDRATAQAKPAGRKGRGQLIDMTPEADEDDPILTYRVAPRRSIMYGPHDDQKHLFNGEHVSFPKSEGDLLVDEGFLVKPSLAA